MFDLVCFDEVQQREAYVSISMISINVPETAASWLPPQASRLGILAVSRCQYRSMVLPSTVLSFVVQVAPESPKLKAVQEIVERLEAQNSPEQRVAESFLPSSVPDCCIGHVSGSDAVHHPALGDDASNPESTAAQGTTARGQETAETIPVRDVHRCMAPLEGMAAGGSTSCIACREAKHELQTMACKVAGGSRSGFPWSQSLMSSCAQVIMA